MKKYPLSFTIDEFDDFITDNNILEKDIVFFNLDENDAETNSISVEDPAQLRETAALWIKENPTWQIYTEVDLDTGEVGYSAGVRIVNTLDHYVAINLPKFGKPNNS